MEKQQQPHRKINERENGLSSAQEVKYADKFRRADRASEGKQT